MTTQTRPPFGRDPGTIVLAVLAVGAMLRYIIAATVGYGVDESYAVAIARQFSWSYFDHPPLLFWMIGGWAKLVGSEREVVLRLPIALCFAGTTWLTYRLAARFFGENAGAIAALLLNVSAEFSLSAGGWLLPDAPLFLMMLVSVTLIAGIVFDDAPRAVTFRWMLAGAAAGAAMLSKYHGVFVLGGTFLFLLTSARHRRWLAHPGPYLGAIVALLIFSPVLYWNSQHHWVSFLFQGGRAGGRGGLHPDTMLTNIAGQVVWALPWVWIPLVGSMWGALRVGRARAEQWFLLCLSVPIVAVFTLIALRGDVGLPHWTAPGYLFAFPLLGAAVAGRLERGAPYARPWIVSSVYGYLALIVVLWSAVATGWVGSVFGSKLAKAADSQTADLIDWYPVVKELRVRRLLPVGSFVAAPSWIQAGKAAVALGPHVPVICLCADPHHFRYAVIDTQYFGANAVILNKVKQGEDVITKFSPYFESVTLEAVVPIYRQGRVAMEIGVYRATHFLKSYPTDQPR